MKIQTILRAQDVARWNIVHTVRKQSMAEHTFSVTMIAWTIGEMLEQFHIMDEIIRYALYHDLEEIITGDVPAPTKRRMEGILEDANWDWDRIADVVKPSVSDFAKRIVKAADKLENLWYIEQYGHGRHANEVKLRLMAELRQGTGPEWNAAREIYHELTHGVIDI